MRRSESKERFRAESRLRQTINVNLYHVTKFSVYLSFAVQFFLQKKYFHVSFVHKNRPGLFTFISLFSILRNSQLESDVRPTYCSAW